jgi:hypothetical protein
MAKAEGVDLSTGNDCMENKVELHNWSSAAKKVLVVQPSPRVLSLPSTRFGNKQESYIKDYVEYCSLEAIQVLRTRVYSMPLTAPNHFLGDIHIHQRVRVPDNGDDEKSKKNDVLRG